MKRLRALFIALLLCRTALAQGIAQAPPMPDKPAQAPDPPPSVVIEPVARSSPGPAQVFFLTRDGVSLWLNGVKSNTTGATRMIGTPDQGLLSYHYAVQWYDPQTAAMNSREIDLPAGRTTTIDLRQLEATPPPPPPPPAKASRVVQAVRDPDEEVEPVLQAQQTMQHRSIGAGSCSSGSCGSGSCDSGSMNTGRGAMRGRTMRSSGGG